MALSLGTTRGSDATAAAGVFITHHFMELLRFVFPTIIAVRWILYVGNVRVHCPV